MGIFADFFKVMKSSFFKNTLKNGDYAVPKLSNARALKVDLSSNDNKNFDGSENVDIGVKGITSILNGGTGANNRKTALDKLALLGLNPIKSISEDTPDKWRNLGTGYAYINEGGFLNNQPSSYGFVVSFVYANELIQFWKSIDDGGIYTRVANRSGWVSTFDSKAEKATYAKYASADTSKGTIEERLTNLGFKEGAFILNDISSASANSLKKIGKFVIANLKTNPTITEYAYVEIPADFLPKQDVTIYAKRDDNYTELIINKKGEIFLGMSQLELKNVGWETN